MVGHSRPRPKDKSISIGCAKCQIFDIWCTKHQKTSHMRCFKIFGIDEQYRSKFRMIRIKMLKKIIIHFLFPLYDFFLLSLSFFFFLLRLTLLSSFCSLSLSLSPCHKSSLSPCHGDRSFSLWLWVGVTIHIRVPVSCHVNLWVSDYMS